MTTNRSKDYLVGLVRELCKLPQETEWVEFKENDAEPENIGEYLSALANSAALAGKATQAQDESRARVPFERLGYFVPDPDSTGLKPVFNRICTLRDSFTKTMSQS